MSSITQPGQPATGELQPTTVALAETDQHPAGVKDHLRPTSCHPLPEEEPSEAVSAHRGWRFWVIFLSLCLSLLLTGIDLAAVGIALPTITSDLSPSHSSTSTASFAWVSSAYTLAATAVIPLAGRLSDTFGRRDVLLSFVALFMIGSAVSGTARSMNMLIAGRSIQGVGEGGIGVLTSIVTADLTTLRERGMYNALIGVAITTASMIGPFISGAIVQRTTWRWLFYMNLPLCGITLAVMFVYLDLKKPAGRSIRQNIAELDWFGNAMIVASSASCIVALTWAGISHPWSSWHVLVPLILGLLGLCATFIYEFRWASHPSIPLEILNNRTSLSGYIQSFFHGLIVMSVAFFVPGYFQAVKGSSPLRAAVLFLPLPLICTPAAMTQGMIVSKTGKYWLMHLIGWSFLLVGLGIATLLRRADTSLVVAEIFQAITAIGVGFVFVTTFSVLAPLPPKLNAQALSMLTFARTFSQSWSTAIGATVLQNALIARLPASFLAQFPKGAGLAYSVIPLVKDLPTELRAQVQNAYAESMREFWIVLLCIAGAGWLCVWFMRELPLHTAQDERWGMKEDTRNAAASAEAGANSDEKMSDEDRPDAAEDQVDTCRRDESKV